MKREKKLAVFIDSLLLLLLLRFVFFPHSLAALVKIGVRFHIEKYILVDLFSALTDTRAICSNYYTVE